MASGKAAALVLVLLWTCTVVLNARYFASLMAEWDDRPTATLECLDCHIHRSSDARGAPSSKALRSGDRPSLADGNSAGAGGDHPICLENTAQSIRAAGHHWRVEAADATVSMYPLGGGTLGVEITSHSSTSAGTMQSFVGRLALQQMQQERLSDQNSTDAEVLHEMSASHHEHRAPAYDDYLGCYHGEQPSGTAVVVVEAFHGGKRNIYHSIANHHGMWLLRQVLELPPAEVTTILPAKYGSPFRYPPRFVSDVLWPMHIHAMGGSEQRNCFERVVFMETTSSPYWGLRFIREQCSEQSPYMMMHRQFHEEARMAALSVIRLGRNNPASGSDGGSGGTAPPGVCYMSRKLRPERTRHFSKSFEAFFDKSLDAWATKYNDAIELHRLEFDESVPFASQVERASECTVLFGAHGAGLGHMIWMPSGATIIEIGNKLTCETYYRSMATWYGHAYTCFSEMDGHGVRHDERQIYHALNVTLLLGVLDDAVALYTQRNP